MLVYWIMYLIPAFIAMQNVGKTRFNKTTWGFVGFVYMLVVGLRLSGGDWYNYFRRFEQMEYLSLSEALEIKDAGYQLLSHYIYHWDLGFTWVTFICAFFSIAGLLVFLRRQLNPWLGLAIAVPYLIIVVDMGYMRQGVALGFVMWGITMLHRGKFYSFILFVLLATTFHKSAIMMIAFGIFSGKRGWFVKAIGISAAGIGVWSAFIGSGVDELIVNYVDTNMQSQGAMIRVLLNAIPAVLLLVFRKKWKKNFNDYTFWMMISLASLASIALVGFASTAVDRMALYFLPLQIVVFTRLPFLAKNVLSSKAIVFLTLLLYFSILFVWLNFAVNSRYWIPYNNLIWAGLF